MFLLLLPSFRSIVAQNQTENETSAVESVIFPIFLWSFLGGTLTIIILDSHGSDYILPFCLSKKDLLTNLGQESTGNQLG